MEEENTSKGLLEPTRDTCVSGDIQPHTALRRQMASDGFVHQDPHMTSGFVQHYFPSVETRYNQYMCQENHFWAFFVFLRLFGGDCCCITLKRDVTAYPPIVLNTNTSLPHPLTHFIPSTCLHYHNLTLILHDLASSNCLQNHCGAL